MLYWEDVELGLEIPSLSKIATTQKLVMWAGASGDFNPLHYDSDFATSQGIGRPVVHGALKCSWLGHLVSNWMGDKGKLRKLSCQYQSLDYPRRMTSMTTPEAGETWWCKGKVTQKYIQDGEHIVECHVWLEDGGGKRTTRGRATVILPSREFKG